MNKLTEFYKDKDILVTGGCGSVGSEVIRQLIKFGVKRIRSFDINESGLFHLQEELSEYNTLRTLVGDVRDKDRLKLAMKGVDIVFHCAALKHVPMCEYNPFEAVETNVKGTQNVIETAREEGVGRLLFISTDKAVNPINTMGATKLLGEKLIMNASLGDSKTKFSCVRFGNVLNSNGSVIPLFLRQIKKGGPVTITSDQMTRFFMSMKDAVKLLIDCVTKMEGHEIFILKMKAVKIIDLANVIIKDVSKKFGHDPKNIEVKNIGIRPGEKLYESLITEEETFCVEDEGNMFIIRPGMNTPNYVEITKSSTPPNKKYYISKDAEFLSEKDIKEILMKENIIN